jgi:hypothetical protein
MCGKIVVYCWCSISFEESLRIDGSRLIGPSFFGRSNLVTDNLIHLQGECLMSITLLIHKVLQGFFLCILKAHPCTEVALVSGWDLPPFACRPSAIQVNQPCSTLHWQGSSKFAYMREEHDNYCSKSLPISLGPKPGNP